MPYTLIFKKFAKQRNIETIKLEKNNDLKIYMR